MAKRVYFWTLYCILLVYEFVFASNILASTTTVALRYNLKSVTLVTLLFLLRIFYAIM